MTNEQIAELRALAEKVTVVRVEVIPYDDGDSLVIHEYGTENRICFMAMPGETSSFRRIEAQADLICLLWNSLPTILTALEALPVMRDALEAVMRDSIGKKVGGGDGGTYVTRPLSGVTIKQVSQALASLPKEVG